MFYLDTSLLVAVLTNGAETERMQHWLGQQPVDDLALSDWMATEFSSALSIKLRTGQIGAAHRADALATSHGSPRTALPSFRSRGCSFGRLRDSRTNIRLGLRAGGALHLAVCAGLGATLCTFEQRLSHAGSALGVKTILLHTRCLSGGTVHRGCS